MTPSRGDQIAQPVIFRMLLSEENGELIVRVNPDLPYLECIIEYYSLGARYPRGNEESTPMLCYA